MKSLQDRLPGNNKGVARAKMQNEGRSMTLSTKIKNEKAVDNLRIWWYTKPEKDLLTQNPVLFWRCWV